MYNNEDFIYYNMMPYNNMDNTTSTYMGNPSDNKNMLYDPYNSLIRGNAFKNLYSPYFKDEPYELKPKNNKERDLYNVMALGFMVTDLNLYLDVNPNDKNMIALFNKYQDEYKNQVNEYEKKYGPIDLSSKTLNAYPWSWNKSMWPWEDVK